MTSKSSVKLTRDERELLTDTKVFKELHVSEAGNQVAAYHKHRRSAGKPKKQAKYTGRNATKFTRINDLGKLVMGRFGDVLPEHDDPFDEYFYAVANAVYSIDECHEKHLYRLNEWLDRFAPWAPSNTAVDNLRRQHASKSCMKASTVGHKLKLTLAERRAFGITSIAASDVTIDEWEADKAQRKREADRVRKAEKVAKERALNGGMTAAQISEQAAKKKQLRDAKGISRTTEWRARKKLENQMLDKMKPSGRIGRAVDVTDKSHAIIPKIYTESVYSRLECDTDVAHSLFLRIANKLGSVRIVGGALRPVDEDTPYQQSEAGDE